MTGFTGAVLACLVGLALMGSLPMVFFRRGRLNGEWWITAGPFLLAAGTLAAAGVGALRPAVRPAGPWDLVLEGVGLGLVVGAAALIGFAAGAHAGPVSLWHQEGDAPDRLVTHGAYRRIRHPFYAAFILLLLASLVAFPHGLTLVAFVTGVIRLDRTAAREERRILDSRHGQRYRAYMEATGRFLPVA